MKELVKFSNDEITLENEFVEKLRAFKKLEREIKAFEKDLKDTALAYMEKNNLKELDSEILSVKYVDGFTRAAVDTDRLKQEGLYEIYKKETDVKPSVRITIK